MNPHVHDVVVVGLGAVGSAALYHLSRRNVRVLGLDRYFPPHIYGSTHNESRIIRKAYFEGARYGPLLDRAYVLWDEMEQVTGQQLTEFCGCLNIGRRDSKLVASAESAAARFGLDLEQLAPSEVTEWFPGFSIPDDCVAVLERNAGCIRPELCIETQLQRATTLGANFRLGEAVRVWTSDADGVTVTTDRHTYTSRSAIFTVGAWLRELAAVPVKIERATNTWFAPMTPWYEPDRCPAFIYEDRWGSRSYGCPDMGRGIKVGLHHVGQLHDHPDDICRKPSADDEAGARQIVERLMPQAAGQSLHTRVCLYTNTPDLHYLIDYLGGHNKQVVIGSACSGHGFKMSCAVGEALASLALNEAPRVDVSPFRWRWPADHEILCA